MVPGSDTQLELGLTELWSLHPAAANFETLTFADDT